MADDLQAAGVQGQEQDAGSLLRALSQGPMQQAQANPNMANWAGLAGFGAGIQGQSNPVVNQIIAAQESDRRQKLATFEVMQSVQRMRRNQQQDQLKVYRDLAGSDHPGAKRMGWEGIGKISGIELPPNILEGLTKGDLSPEKMDLVAARIHAHWDDATILKYTPGITADMLPPLKQYAQSDKAKKALGMETGPQAEKRALDEELKRTKAALDELKFRESQRKTEQGERRLDAIERGLDISQQRANDYTRWVTAQMGKINTAIGTKEQKRLETLNVMEDAITMMETHAAALNAKKFLPQGTDVLSMARAKANQTIFPGDPDWVAWKQLQASLIGFDRTVLNDIGARAFQAFKNQFSFFDNPPPKEAIDLAIKNMRALLKTAREGKQGVTEKVTVRLPNGKIMQADDYHPGDPLPPGAQIIKVE